MKRFAVCTAVLTLPLLSVNGQQATPTKRAPTPKHSPTATMLVDTDDTCHLYLDDIDEGNITPSHSLKLQAESGEHIVKCSVDKVPDLVWRKVIEVKPPGQAAVVVSLKTSHNQYDQAIEQQQQAAAAAEHAVEQQKAQTEAASRAKEEFPQKLFDKIKGNWGGLVLQRVSDDGPKTNSYRLSFDMLNQQTITATLWVDSHAHLNSVGKETYHSYTYALNLNITPEGFLVEPDLIRIRIMDSEHIQLNSSKLLSEPHEGVMTRNP